MSQVAYLGPIMHILPLPNHKYALAASKYTHVALIHLETMRVVNNAFITFGASIRSLCLADAHTLLAGLDDGSIVKVNLLPVTKLDGYLDCGDYKEAYALCEHEPLLQYTGSYKVLETHFDQCHAEAKLLLSQNRIKAARELLENKCRGEFLLNTGQKGNTYKVDLMISSKEKKQ